MSEEVDLNGYYEIVENAISELGVDAREARGEAEGQWNLKRGNASIWIDLWYIEEEEGAYFQVMSPIMTLPEEDDKKHQMYEELLKHNYSIFGVAFTLHEDGIYLKGIREVEGLDMSEVIFMIGRCGNYADSYNEQLVKSYGGRRIE